jgi:putative copper resistance protein D
MRASQVISDASLNPAALALVLAAGAAYLAGARRAHPRWPVRRTLSFLAGLAVLAAASETGIDTWSERLLSVHMAQHLLIIVAAAPLLVAGAPVSLALRTLPRGGRDGLVGLLRTPAVDALTRPPVALALLTAVLLATHVPTVYDAALTHPLVHGLEHAAYLWAALLFWAPVIAVDPLPHRLSPIGNVGYLLAAMVPMSAIGAVLISSDTVVYAPYLASARAAGVSALADQRSGATVMWLGGTLVLVAATLGAAWVSMLREERRARAREAQADRRAAGASPAGGAR